MLQMAPLGALSWHLQLLPILSFPANQKLKHIPKLRSISLKDSFALVSQPIAKDVKWMQLSFFVVWNELREGARCHSKKLSSTQMPLEAPAFSPDDCSACTQLSWAPSWVFHCTKPEIGWRTSKRQNFLGVTSWMTCTQHEPQSAHCFQSKPNFHAFHVVLLSLAIDTFLLILQWHLGFTYSQGHAEK